MLARLRIFVSLLTILAATGAFAAERLWQQGVVENIEIRQTQNKTGKHVYNRYLCTISGPEFSYQLELDRPLNAAVHDPITFRIDKKKIDLRDADGKQRKAAILVRIRNGQPVPPLPQ